VSAELWVDWTDARFQAVLFLLARACHAHDPHALDVIGAAFRAASHEAREERLVARGGPKEARRQRSIRERESMRRRGKVRPSRAKRVDP